uniref:GH26 domain-containing protein n=1 Tax=Neobodo designis TaxID=312471 RepID=A0A7S1W7E2_NEODS
MAYLAVVAFLAIVAGCQGAAIFGTFTPQVKQGVFTNMNYWLGQADSGAGPQQALRIVEVGWQAPDPTTGHIAAIDDIRNAWGWSGAVPIVTWMPYGYKTWTSSTPNDDIVSGVYDDYIDAFLSQLRDRFVFEPNAVIKRLYLRFAPQPNGDWFPWSPFCPGCASNGQHINQTAASYKAMWQYVLSKVRDPKYNFTADTVQIVFDAATFSASGPVENFAPPSDLVHWFVMTGINWGNTLPGNSWVTPTQLFGSTLASLQAIAGGKPIGIASAGSTSVPKGVEGKSTWLTQLCTFVTTNGLKMMTYHNADSSTDVAVFGGSVGPGNFSSPVDAAWFRMYPAFRDCVAGPGFHGRNQTDPRYLSDAQFAGTS